MKKTITLLLFLVSLVSSQELIRHFGLDKRNAYEYTANYTFETSIDDQKHILIIKNLKGDISIVGSIDSQISIDEEILIYASTKREAEKTVELGTANIQKQKDNQIVSIQGSAEKFDSDAQYVYTIRHPKNVSIEIDALGGDIEIENIIGEIKLKSKGGDINFDRILGKINSRTAGGDIFVNDSEGSFSLITGGGDIDVRGAGGKISASTQGGDMSVESYNGNVALESEGGSIILEQVYGKTITAMTKGGDIDAESIKGNINIRTYGGNIEIIDLTGDLKAETNAGDIELLQILGEVNVSTEVGDIDCLSMYGPVKAFSKMGDIQVQKLVGKKIKTHGLDLYTNYGDISVKLPMELTIELDAMVKDVHNSIPIQAEFPVIITQTMDETIGHALRGLDSIHHIIKLKSRRGTIIIEDI